MIFNEYPDFKYILIIFNYIKKKCFLPYPNLFLQNLSEDNESGPKVIKKFSCSTQLSMKFFPLINVKMPTIVGILICMSGKIPF